jgi:vanillate O-demethylase ferredoxin subunit
VRLADGAWAERHYSLVSDPADRGAYEIGVLLEPGGSVGSRFLHEQITQGDRIETGLPRNAFPLVAGAQHSILIAGGIGITPILAMLRRLVCEDRSFELHYSERRASHLAFRAAIEAFAANRAWFCASREAGGSRIDVDAVLRSPRPGTHVYVCGPRRLIEDVRETATHGGWDAGQIHFESFGSKPSPGETRIRVHLARSGRSFDVPPGQSILDTLLDAGIAVPHDCKRGECSLCATRVLKGEPEHRDLCLSSDERRQSMCICVSRAKSDELTLDR